MKALAVLLMTLAASGQTTKKKCPEPPETIPYTAVEPVRDEHSQPFCPREEYELKWFVETDETPTYSVLAGGEAYSCGAYTCSLGVKAKSSLVFKPMCVRKEE